MKKLIAIGVILFPSKKIVKESIRLNKSITDSQNRILLDSQKCVPHISLAMGCTDVENLAEIQEIVKEIARRYEPLKLKVMGLKTRKIFSALEIEKTEKIQELHEDILNELGPFMNENSTKDAFVKPTTINNLTLGWVDNFRKTSSFDKFWPHITLGYGEIKEIFNISKEFTSSIVGIYQLGVFCTCKKNLFSKEL